ncbi:cellulose biosynthesis cyclic di-GMP-binding regulatory protein BcsB [Pseudoroseomonas wenyumeiae]
MSSTARLRARSPTWRSPPRCRAEQCLPALLPAAEPEPGWPWNWIARRVRAAGTGDRSEGQVGLPPYLIFGQNELQLRFDMRPLNRGDCVSIPGDVRASIDPDSTLDLSRGYRFTEMPNLAFFAGSGFPYTRLADFAETAAVLPERPTGSEISAFLTLLGRLSANVGHAATRIAIARPSGIQEVANRDLMLIGAITRQPALADMLRDRSPLQIEGNRVTLSLGMRWAASATSSSAMTSGSSATSCRPPWRRRVPAAACCWASRAHWRPSAAWWP